MKNFTSLFVTVFLACAAAFPAEAREPDRTWPTPPTVSRELQKLIAAQPFPYWNDHPKSAHEWKTWADARGKEGAKGLDDLRKQLGVTVTPGNMDGVPIFTLTPKDLPKTHEDRVLLHLHGGGYVLGAGESGTQEAILMAGIGKFRVVYADYRMAPDFPYPAAIDDAMTVYRALLKTKSAKTIGVFGTSTGGGMTLILTLRAKVEGLPLPAAIAAGTPWTDLTKTGDSYFTNQGVDNVLVSYDGWLGDAARLYAGEHNLKDPMISPVYGDVRGFPPTLLTSGTRDLFLSNTVRMHLKLREAGVSADLIVFEGISHAQYHMVPPVLQIAPETRFHFSELGRFFSRHLH